MAAVIAMSGCAKRNADRELARVTRHAERFIADLTQELAKETPHTRGFSRVAGGLAAIVVFVQKLRAGEHRTGEAVMPAPPPVPPASRIGDEVEYLPEVKR